ncbi:hypothetical protein QQF64_009545 [Cirrhinus molitorella]|uniref:Uncharacterized protein n=1 Tax=Cirrhinus molitorella TaxID=172907 RepID=A0ABR3M1H3_9TELE
MTVGSVGDTSPTHNPEPSLPPPVAELHEPTADGEPEHAAIVMSPSEEVTERAIVTEPEHKMSDQLSLGPRSLRLRCGSPDLRLRLGRRCHLFRLGPPDHRLSVSALGSTSTCSATVGQPHGVVSPSSTMAPPAVGSAVGHRHGWGLDTPVVSLAPPSC